MSPNTFARNSVLVAKLQLQRAWRRAREKPKVLLAKIGFLVAGWVYVFFIAPQLGGQGVQTADSSEVDPALVQEATRGMVAVLWLSYVALATWNTPGRSDQVPGSAFLLRSAGVRSTLWGNILAKYARRLVLYGVFVAATALTILWGFDLPTRSPVILLNVLVLFLTAELTGTTIRLAIGAAGLRPARRTLVVLGGIAIAVISLSFEYPMIVLGILAKTPPADFGELFLQQAPSVQADRRAALRIVIAGLVAIPVLGVIAERAARRTWFSSDIQTETRSDRTSVGRWIGSLGITGPARAVAWRLWLQSRRRPLVVGLIGVPFLLVGLAVVDPAGTDAPVFPLFVGLYSVWMTGTTLALSPFSAEDETLSHLLSATGREIVGGYALTAMGIGFPVTVLSVIVAGVLMGPAPLILPGTVVSVAVLAGTVPSGIAIGLLLPRIETVSKRTDGPIMGSKFAMAGNGVVFLALAGPGSVALYFSEDVLFSPLALTGICATLGLSAGVAVVSFRYASQRIDSLTLD